MLDSNFQVNDSEKFNFLCHKLINSKYCCRRDYSENCIPKSDCLKLIANSEQILSSIAARRLLTYEKIAEPISNKVKNLDQLRDDFRHKFFTRDEAERLERLNQKAELKETARQEAAKREKTLINKEKS